MSIQYNILGNPGRDNSVFIRVDRGNKLYRIQIDCGENTISNLNQTDVKSIDILLFSHLHLDHVAGFDYFFRRTFDQDSDPVIIFGPEGTSAILHNRFRGFKWNLTEGLNGRYYVNDILEKTIDSYLYKAKDGFTEKTLSGTFAFNYNIVENKDFSITAAHLNHSIPSIGYNIKETDSININKEELDNSGIEAGPWINKIKNLSISADESLVLNNKNYNIGLLREKLLIITPGEGISYLTDFVCDDASQKKAINLVKHSDVLICESQYLSEDESLAQKNYHLTARQAALIALEGRVKKLILFHVSERYIHNVEKMKEILNEARKVFPEAYFPEHWNEFYNQ